MGKKKKLASDEVRKTLVIAHKFNKDEQKIINFMALTCKNIFNCTVFYHSIFIKYKTEIFTELRTYFKSISKNNVLNITKDDILVKVCEIMESKVKLYVSIKNVLQHNNNIIYKYIIKKIKESDIYLCNDNYNDFKKKILSNVLKLKDLQKPKEHLNDVTKDIVERICNSIYIRNYNDIKNKLLNKIPINISNKNFIDQVKAKECLCQYGESTIKEEIQKEFKIRGKKVFKLTSDQNYITRYTYRHLNENTGVLMSDMTVNVMNKTFDAINNYYRLRAVGLKAHFPKYLPKNFLYTVFQQDRNIREENKQYKFSVGKYISDNLNTIIKNTKYISIFKKKYETIYTLLNNARRCKLKKNKFYTNKNELLNEDQNYIFKHNEKYYYISTKAETLYSGYYLYLPKPDKLNNENIKINQIEIVPQYDGHSYQIHYSYTETITPVKVNTLMQPNNVISIDLGLKNLMTIYDPCGKQKIIKGSYIISLNKYYNRKIDTLKSIAKKLNNKETTKQIRSLLIKRSNKINNYFNLLASWFAKNYKGKNIIMGYNKEWKTKVDLGKINNRKFYEIPFSKMLDKLQHKMQKIGNYVETIEESYTSKCDALSLESVEKHTKYMGQRTKRGMFISKKGKKINADLNGAINIYRKYFDNNGHKIKQIKGKSIFNPCRVNIF